MNKLSNLIQDVWGEDMALATYIYYILTMYLQCILLTYSTLSLNIACSSLSPIEAIKLKHLLLSLSAARLHI